MQELLESITVKNFQCHTDSVIELDQDSNVVVISGSSDNGKSSIFRSIGLALNNRPSGYGYKPHTAKKKDITDIILKFSDGTVKRRKSASIDEYIIEADGYSKEPFTALSRQVPEEVKTFLNLNESSFQSQHEPHFFISKTPGERAKLLNEVSGLEIIDKSITNINSLIKVNSANLEKTKDTIIGLNQKKEEIVFANEADTLLISIENKLKEIDALILRNQKLQNYCLEVERVETKIKELKDFLKVKQYATSISNLIKEYEQVENRNLVLAQYVDRISTLNAEIDKKKDFLKVKDSSKSLTQLIDQYNQLLIKNNRIKKYRKELSDIDETIKSISTWLKVKDKYQEIVNDKIELDKLKERQIRLQNYVKKALSYNLKVDVLVKKVEEVKNKKRVYMDKFSVCPFCGKEK